MMYNAFWACISVFGGSTAIFSYNLNNLLGYITSVPPGFVWTNITRDKLHFNVYIKTKTLDYTHVRGFLLIFKSTFLDVPHHDLTLNSFH